MVAKNTRTRVTKRKAKPRSKLDPAALSYARLLADPCNGPLVHPTYSGTEGGYLIRADSFVNFSGGAGETAGYFTWQPGLISATNNQILYAATTAGNITGVATAGGTSSPGYSFLSTNASAARCIAACVKLTFSGAESTRSGRIHYGQVTSGIVQAGVAYGPDNIAQALPYYERCPAGVIEIIWKPNDADQLFSRPAGLIANDSAKNDKAASIAVAFAGLPAATGITAHFTAVYEWQPLSAIGLANPNLSKSFSNNSLDEVVNYLIEAGHTFVRSTAMAAGRTIGAGALAAAYGLLAPGLQARNMRQLQM